MSRASRARSLGGAALICATTVACAAGGTPEPPLPSVATLGVSDDDGWSSGSGEDTDDGTGVIPGGDTTDGSEPGDSTGDETGSTTQPGCAGDCVENCFNGIDDDGDGDGDCDDLDCEDHLVCSCVPAPDVGHGLHVLCPEPTTWAEARDACLASDMHLVTIDGVGHNQWLVQQAQPLSASSWWMGFSDLDAEGSWTWVDDTPVTYQNWYPGEPNDGIDGPEDCAAFPEHTETAWNDLSCAALHPFICEL